MVTSIENKILKEELKELRREYKEKSELFAQVADYMMRLGQVNKAVRVINRGIEQYPEYPTGWLVKGNLHAFKNEMHEARLSYKRALEFDPDIPYAHERCGELAREAGDIRDYYDHLLRLADLDALDGQLQVMAQTVVLRGIALKHGLYSKDEVEEVLPGVLRQALLKKQLIPGDLARTDRRWSMREGSQLAPVRSGGESEGEPEEIAPETSEPDEVDVRKAAAEPTSEDIPDSYEDEQEPEQEMESPRVFNKEAMQKILAKKQQSEPTGPAAVQDVEMKSGEPSDEEMRLSNIAEEVTGSKPRAKTKPKTATKGKGKGIATRTLAELYVSQGDLGKAIEVYDKLIEQKPDNEQFLQRRDELRQRAEEDGES